MNAELLLKHFERISDAPDAVARLRHFVLDLAVTGKLVEQSVADEPSSELLKRVAAEKYRSNSKRATTAIAQPERQKPSPLVNVPPGWTIATLESLCTSITDGDHLPPPKAETGIPFLVIGNVRTQELKFEGCRFVPEHYYQGLNQIRQPRKGDILYTLVGSYGIPILVEDDRPFCVQRHIGILRPVGAVNATYLTRILQSRFVFNQASQCATGIAQKTVSLAGLRKICIPIPPEAEQSRILVRLNDCLALCDKLEAAQTEREKRRDRLVAASLKKLSNSANDDEVRSNATFYFNHLPRLASRVEDVDQLRQNILDLAVKGLVVPQRKEDESGDQLLARITKQRDAFVKAGTISEIKVASFPTADDLGFHLKPGWTPVKLGQILIELQTGPFGSSLHQSDYVKGGVPVVNPASIQDGRIVPIESMAVGKETLERLSTFKLRPHDIVMGRRGEMGRCAVVKQQEAGWLCGTGSLVLRLPEGLHPPYVAMLIGAPASRRYLGSSAVGATMQNLNQSILLNMPLGLPPFEEQRRIVERIGHLMGICDAIVNTLQTAQRGRSRLLDSILQRAFEADDFTEAA